MVLGRVCFHIENAGMGGMGWDGKGRDVMGWEWGWGEVQRAKKIGKITCFLPTNHSQASLWRPFGFCGAACGTLGAPVCAPFYHFGGAGAFLGRRSKKKQKKKRNTKHKLMPQGMRVLPYLLADEY